MARSKKKGEDLSLVDLLNGLSKDLKRQAVRPNIYGYQPHEKQKLFHSGVPKWHRSLYIGGNRSGKSYGTVAEDLIWMLHLRDDIPDEPIRGRVVAVDFDRGVEQILLPIFKELAPPSKLVGGSWDSAWSRKERILKFVDGGQIQFMSYEQDLEKFAGTSLHFVHYDEEPPKHIYNECEARLVDTNGKSWISMTPVNGMTWVYYEICQPGEDSDDRKIIAAAVGDASGPVWEVPSMSLRVIETWMDENPHLSPEARERYLATLDEDERTARRKGQFVQVSGKVFASFSQSSHTIGDFDPKAAQEAGWQIYTSTDHGWNSPTAWLWHAVSPQGRVVTFAEHYQSHMTIEEHSHKVISMEEGWGLNRDDIMRTGDPAMKQHNAVSGTSIIMEYQKHELHISVDTVPRDASVGLGIMQRYFRLKPIGKDGKLEPTWMVSMSCPNFVKELKNLRFATYASKKLQYNNNAQEQVHKKDDHAYDSAKYFASFLPELAPDSPDRQYGPIDPGRGTLTYDVALTMQLRDAETANETTKWVTLETYT